MGSLEMIPKFCMNTCMARSFWFSCIVHIWIDGVQHKSLHVDPVTIKNYNIHLSDNRRSVTPGVINLGVSSDPLDTVAVQDRVIHSVYTQRRHHITLQTVNSRHCLHIPPMPTQNVSGMNLVFNGLTDAQLHRPVLAISCLSRLHIWTPEYLELK